LHKISGMINLHAFGRRLRGSVEAIKKNIAAALF